MGGDDLLAAQRPTEDPRYEDWALFLDRQIVAGAPQVVTGSVGLLYSNPSTGDRYQLGLSAAATPGGATVGPAASIGGLKVGLFTNGTFQGPLRFTPQVGLGDVTFNPAAGVCSGIWCIGAGGAGPIHPAAAITVAVLEALGSVSQLEREERESVPPVIASAVTSVVVPIAQIRGTLGSLGIGTGSGPRAERLSTVASLQGYRRTVEGIVSSGNRRDAANRLAEAVAIRQEPLVEASLRNLLDRAYAAENTKGIPNDRIGKNIRRAVEEVEAFHKRNAGWIETGKGVVPVGIDRYLAASIYLAEKTHFLVEPFERGGRLVFKIRESTPFQLKDPELAVRFLEATAGIWAALADGRSGLVAELARRTTLYSNGLVRAIEKRPLDGDGVLRAEARFGWHLEWLRTMNLLYRGGFFHRRLAHLRGMVREEAAGKVREGLLARIERLNHPDLESLSRSVEMMTSSGAISQSEYSAMSIGIGALRLIEELERGQFPDWESGDGTLLFDRERTRGFAGRLEIVDALSGLAAIYKSLGGPELKERPREMGWLNALGKEARRRIISLMRANPGEVRHERHRYWSKFPSHLKTDLVARLGESLEALGEIDLSNLEPRLVASEPVKGFASCLERTRKALASLAVEARSFRTEAADFGRFDRLFEVEARESARMNAVAAAWQELFRSYETLKSAMERSAAARWDGALARAASALAKGMRNYERFNARRVGRFFLASYADQVGVKAHRSALDDMP